MTNAYSKPTLPFSCYEIGHTWDPSCHLSAFNVGLSTFEESLKIYSSVYLLSSLLGGRLPLSPKSLFRISLSILQSSLFLACNGYSFIAWFCIVRKIFGRFNYLTSAFVPSFIANYISILVERPSRRPALTVYVTNVASETLYNMFVARGWIKPIKNGDVLIFALTLAGLFRWYRSTKDTSNFNYKLVKTIVGDEEIKPVSTAPSMTSSVSSSPLVAKHPLCPHKDACLLYSFKAIGQRFVYGTAIHACFSLVLSLPQILRKPSNLLKVLLLKKHLKFGAFLATIVGAFRGVLCVLRWLRNVNSANHSAIAGLVAGSSIVFYRNTSILLYITWKTLETLYHEGMENGWLPRIPGFTPVLYSLSTSILFQASVLEPHNLKPAYWKFLMRITGNRIAQMNRKMLDVMGTGSSTLLPDFEAIYDHRFTSEEFQKELGLL